MSQIERLGFSVYPQGRLHCWKVDFLFWADDGRRAVVEIDGPGHRTGFRKSLDQDRDALAQRFGFLVLRFENDRVLRYAANCVRETLQELEALQPLGSDAAYAYDQEYRRFLVEQRLHRADSPRLTKISLKDPRGDQYDWLIYDVAQAYRASADGDYREEKIRDRVYTVVSRELSSDPTCYTRQQIESLFTRRREEMCRVF